MSQANEGEQLLVDRIRAGDAESWEQLIAKYEGRLQAFAQSRLGPGGSVEDVVQETFIGFLTSLPNYDARRQLETYLFSICAHKLTDHLRREGRRPTLPFSTVAGSQDESLHFPDMGPGPSTIVRGGERQATEEKRLAEALRAQVQHWQQQGNWVKLECLELLFARGKSNKEVANWLRLTEQQVANFKSDFLSHLQRKVGEKVEE